MRKHFAFHVVVLLLTASTFTFSFHTARAQTAYESPSYWQAVEDRTDEVLNSSELIPAFVKKSTEFAVTNIWRALVSVKDHLSKDQIERAAGALELITDAMNSLDHQSDHTRMVRLRRLMKSLSPYAQDEDMRACYTGYVIHSDIINSFNTGCRVFVSDSLMDILNDDQLRATLAHEISHGDMGDVTRTYGGLIATFGVHMAKLIRDELIWMVTGEIQDYNAQVLEKGNAELIFNAFGKKTRHIEMRADQNGTRLLIRAGRSPNDLKEAIVILTRATGEMGDADDADSDKVRPYPLLQNRLDAIDAAAQEMGVHPIDKSIAARRP